MKESPLFLKSFEMPTWLLAHTRKFPKHQRFVMAKLVVLPLLLIAEGARAEPASEPDPAPKPPPSIQRQIDAHERARSDWEGRMFLMKVAFRQTQAFGKRDVPDARKLEAWRRFADEHAEDNPYSREDDRMRREARMQIVRLGRRVPHEKE